MMLQTPERGFALSVKKHNGELDIHADWVEASALFVSDTVSRSDVVDALMEGNTYRTQGFANEWVSTVFQELDRRFSLLGVGGALVREGNRIRRVRSWDSRPAYSFCVALGMLPHYRDHVFEKCGQDYTEQGALFEELSAESLQEMDWEIERVGWSKGAATALADKVDALASALGEPTRSEAIGRWTAPRAKDAGLDLVAWRSFPDRWGGRPVVLVQCASGENWTEKLHTPNIDTWRKLIDFSTKPLRALTMPFAPEEDEFRIRANTDLVVLLMDRHRLLYPSRDNATGFPSSDLAKALVEWTTERVDAFPKDS
jgi:hypothetical protein